MLPTKLIEKDGEWYQVQKLTHKPNLDHVETVSGSADEYYTYSELADTRKARPQQRRLFFALLSDIYTWSGMPTDFLKNLFYLQYESYTFGKQISLSDTTESSVSDANQLLDLVIDFMFEWHVPFKEGYKLLPREQEYYLFQCCRHRVCMICGNRADIHHVDVIGAGMNRNNVDHTKRHVMALCRIHHSEIEQIGPAEFSTKYHVPVDGIRLDEETLKRIGLRGNYSSD
nr:putative HNHc nuclease [Lactiplantibacillus pentosus]